VNPGKYGAGLREMLRPRAFAHSRSRSSQLRGAVSIRQAGESAAGFQTKREAQPGSAVSGRLRGSAQLDADGRGGNPLIGVAPGFTSEAVAVLADDRDVRLAVQVDGFTAECLHKERARREMNDSRSFGVSGVELHAGSIPYEADDREGPGAVGRRRHSGPPPLPSLYVG
jgi:hypothetical protein